MLGTSWLYIGSMFVAQDGILLACLIRCLLVSLLVEWWLHIGDTSVVHRWYIGRMLVVYWLHILASFRWHDGPCWWLVGGTLMVQWQKAIGTLVTYCWHVGRLAARLYVAWWFYVGDCMVVYWQNIGGILLACWQPKGGMMVLYWWQFSGTLMVH